MKRTAILSAILAAGFFACCTTESRPSSDEGSLKLSIEAGDVLVQTRSNISDYTVLPSGSDFDAEIINSIGQSVWKGKISQWKESTPLATGDYSVYVKYGDITKEGPDLPYLEGSADFTIVGLKTTQVNIPATLANCIVHISFTEAFRNYFPEYDITLTSAASNEFKFSQAQAPKAIFIDAYKFTLSGKLTSQAGTESDLPSKLFENLESAVCYNLVLDASTVGGVKINISFNDEVQTVDLGKIEIK